MVSNLHTFGKRGVQRNLTKRALGSVSRVLPLNPGCAECPGLEIPSYSQVLSVHFTSYNLTFYPLILYISSPRRITWTCLPPLKKCITPTLMLRFGNGVQNLAVIAADILTFSVYILSYLDCVPIGDSMLRLSPYYSPFKLTSWRDSCSS